MINFEIKLFFTGDNSSVPLAGTVFINRSIQTTFHNKIVESPILTILDVFDHFDPQYIQKSFIDLTDF